MSVQLDKSSLQYLGEEYQYKLIKEFMEDKSCFKDLAPIIDQNMFTGQYLRMYVGTMLEYFRKHNDVPSYSSMSIELRQKAHTQADIEICDGIVEKIRNTPSEGSDQIRSLATKFFKQQNIIKAANEMLRLAGNGNIDNFEKCEQLLKDALNTGNHEDYEESRLFDGIDDTLSDDFRTVIPTGIGKIDETLNGGIGKGELGIILGPSSFGKVQPYDAKIATPDGMLEMRDIHVGSQIIGADGKPHTVTAVFPHKDWDFYKVTFSDGSVTECGMEHLWNVNSYRQRHRTNKNGERIPDYSFKTKTLQQLVESGLTCKGKTPKYRVPLPKPVEFNPITVKIGPYLMGLLLGDRSFTRKEIVLHRQDKEDILQNIESAKHYFKISKGRYGFYKIKPYEQLKKVVAAYYNPGMLLGERYIHKDYLYNSVENRIALLHGLMDSNCGHAGSEYCTYTTNSLRLAQNIRTLIQSLGGTASVVKLKPFKNSPKPRYSVRILYFNPEIPLFTLKRKQSIVHYDPTMYLGRNIKTVTYSRKCDGQCIKVDAEDELYLTDDFIVTHNTSLTTALALHASRYKCEQNNNKGFKVIQIVFEDRIKQIQRKHFSRITQVEACNLSKEEYAQYVRDILDNYEDKEIIQENLRIIRLKSGEKSIDFIIDLIKKHINRGFRPDLVIIDYFECIKLTGSSSLSKWDKETLIMRKIESCANELNLAFWVPVQGNKDSINADLVTMDNGGGSIGKIQVGHIIMSITRSLEDIAANIATIAILKNRAGASGRVINGAFFNNGTCTISTDNIEEFDSTIDFGKRRMERQEQQERDMTREIFLSTRNGGG